MKEMQDRVAVVTGGGSGIGLASAVAFAKAGMHVMIADVDEAGMRAACQAIEAQGRKAFSVRTDVASASEVKELYEQTLSKAGGVHLIMNNAGICRFGQALSLSDDDWQRVIDVDLWGVIHGVRTFAPHLVAQGEGHIVNTASLAGILGVSGCASYVAAKFGVVGLSEALRWELADSNVGVTVVCPGMVRTQIAEKTNAEHIKRTLSRFGAPPEKLAALIVKAVRRNHARVLFGAEPKVMDGLRRISPAALEQVGKVLAQATRRGEQGSLKEA